MKLYKKYGFGQQLQPIWNGSEGVLADRWVDNESIYGQLDLLLVNGPDNPYNQTLFIIKEELEDGFVVDDLDDYDYYHKFHLLARRIKKTKESIISMAEKLIKMSCS